MLAACPVSGRGRETEGKSEGKMLCAEAPRIPGRGVRGIRRGDRPLFLEIHVARGLFEEEVSTLGSHHAVAELFRENVRKESGEREAVQCS